MIVDNASHVQIILEEPEPGVVRPRLRGQGGVPRGHARHQQAQAHRGPVPAPENLRCSSFYKVGEVQTCPA
jgi:hypothetical protein